jgi:hydrogenase expression/formation protein HypC
MCLAVPMQVVSVEGESAQVQGAGTRLKIRTDLLPDIKPGEYVLVHAGFAIERVRADEAEENLRLLEETFGRKGGAG